MSCDVEVRVGRRMRRRRRLLSLTAEELAAKCGVGVAEVLAFENGEGRLSVAMLWRLACALEVDTGYFFVDVPPAVLADQSVKALAANAA